MQPDQPAHDQALTNYVVEAAQHVRDVPSLINIAVLKVRIDEVWAELTGTDHDH